MTLRVQVPFRWATSPQASQVQCMCLLLRFVLGIRATLTYHPFAFSDWERDA